MSPSDKNQNRSEKMSGVAILQLSGASPFPRGEINFHPKHGLFFPVIVIYYLRVAAAPSFADPPGSVLAAGSPGPAVWGAIGVCPGC